ncbi:MAG: hypothetical protein MI743_02595 [Sneathiellales bacterium]|nr:hypothetical protein [Sneathiellales bacterium]
MAHPPAQEGYIIEFVPVGKAVKVSAMDPATLTEVSIVGPTNASRAELQLTVIRKLQYVLNKKAGEKTTKNDPPSGKGGIIV